MQTDHKYGHKLDSCVTELNNENLGCLNTLAYVELCLVPLISAAIKDEPVTQQHGHLTEFGKNSSNFTPSRIIYSISR